MTDRKVFIANQRTTKSWLMIFFLFLASHILDAHFLGHQAGPPLTRCALSLVTQKVARKAHYYELGKEAHAWSTRNHEMRSPLSTPRFSPPPLSSPLPFCCQSPCHSNGAFASPTAVALHCMPLLCPVYRLRPTARTAADTPCVGRPNAGR